MAFGPRLHGLSEAEISLRVQEALEAVGLPGLGDVDPFILTKGSRQRVAVAGTLATKPEVIILDEPTTGLDHHELQGMMALMRRLNETGHTIVIVTHAMDIAAAYARRVILMQRGRIVCDGPTREVFADDSRLLSLGLTPPPAVRGGEPPGHPRPHSRRARRLSHSYSRTAERPTPTSASERRTWRRTIAMNLFLYLDRDSPVHRLDPRTKLFLLLASFVAAVLFIQPAPLLALLAVLLAYAALGRALGNLRRVWVLLGSIAVVSIASWSVFARGSTPLFWRISWEGLQFGVAAAIKIDAMIISGLIFLSTTKTEEIILGLIRMRVPYQAAFAFSLAIRMVPTIIGTAVTVTEAQRSRGLDLTSGGLLARMRNHIPLLVPIFLHTLRNTDQLAKALESRGFGAPCERTSYLEIGFHPGDVLALALASLILAGFFILRFAL